MEVSVFPVGDIPCSPTPVSPTLDQKVAFRLLLKIRFKFINHEIQQQYNSNTTVIQYLDISVC